MKLYETVFTRAGNVGRIEVMARGETWEGEKLGGYLTTHVLDTATGKPAAGLEIELFRLDGEQRERVTTMTTNADGRTDAPILPEAAFALGTYELLFHTGAYLDAAGVAAEAPRFLDEVPIRFAMSEPVHYHVPLLLSPFGYSTYRGS